MKNRSVASLAVGAALALALAPLASSAHEGHCKDIFLLSGFIAEGNVVGTNPGAPACFAGPILQEPLFDESPAHADTNTTVPQATHAWVGLFDTFAQPQAGTMKIGGGPEIALTFTRNDVRGRWESQPVSLDGVAPGTPIVVTVDVHGELQTITYTRV